MNEEIINKKEDIEREIAIIEERYMLCKRAAVNFEGKFAGFISGFAKPSYSIVLDKKWGPNNTIVKFYAKKLRPSCEKKVEDDLDYQLSFLPKGYKEHTKNNRKYRFGIMLIEKNKVLRLSDVVKK